MFNPYESYMQKQAMLSPGVMGRVFGAVKGMLPGAAKAAQPATKALVPYKAPVQAVSQAPAKAVIQAPSRAVSQASSRAVAPRQPASQAVINVQPQAVAPITHTPPPPGQQGLILHPTANGPQAVVPHGGAPAAPAAPAAPRRRHPFLAGLATGIAGTGATMTAYNVMADDSRYRTPNPYLQAE